LDTKIKVEISPSGSQSYEVYIGRTVGERLGTIVKSATDADRATVISNPEIWKCAGAVVDTSLQDAGITFDLIEIPEGETAKTLTTCQAIYEALTTFGAGRHDAIIAVGGGVIGDLAGFLAATYMRGVPFVNVPTTLLAQVDSSIGGKTGVDLPAGKNLVGVFYQPAAVISDIGFLATLPDREIRSGLAEIIKSAALAGDGFLEHVERQAGKLKARDEAALTEAVRRSVRFKADVVAGDERDQSDRRAVLNYGHTFGHALEAASGYTGPNHGEAIAAGLVFAAKLGVRIGVGSQTVVDTLVSLLERADLAPNPLAVATKDLLKAMRLDKKKSGQDINFVLLEDFGRPVIQSVDEPTIAALIKEMRR